MAMKRLQVQFDEHDYQNIRKICFIENKAISEIIREATKQYLDSKNDINQKLQEVFASEKEVEESLNKSIEDFSEVYQKLAQ